ncbi:DsbA family oxidoreductase [Pseudomonas sp. LFM046]|uniref:DsbA family oxidoreductase n=1 Tax=Pseudomonas sp. LFM046 TaxID=1608357 RepID=UPI0005CF93E8|nr:DsbA family oxidoreductase [Pseudomonas sp. LFM046]
MSTAIRIDFISDLVCPWCAIALGALEQALERLPPDLAVDLNFEPFELNPSMPAAGQNAVEHIMQKYGSSAEDIARSQEHIRALGRDVGIQFDLAKRTHFFNTFDSHRLMHWAKTRGQEHRLAQALFRAYFTDGRNISDHETLAELADEAGLPREQALEVLTSGQFGEEVKAREHFYTSRGVHGVPAILLNGRQLISGAQPADYFEQALLQVAAGT